MHYASLEVLATWHLTDRWWEAGNPGHPRGGFTDRLYYRVLCKLHAWASLAVFEVYYDLAQNTWVMDH